MTFEDMEWCPNTGVPLIEPADGNLQFMFVLGVQKAASTWLHRALIQHPVFVEADTPFGCAPPPMQPHTCFNISPLAMATGAAVQTQQDEINGVFELRPVHPGSKMTELDAEAHSSLLIVVAAASWRESY